MTHTGAGPGWDDHRTFDATRTGGAHLPHRAPTGYSVPPGHPVAPDHRADPSDADIDRLIRAQHRGAELVLIGVGLVSGLAALVLLGWVILVGALSSEFATELFLSAALCLGLAVLTVIGRVVVDLSRDTKRLLWGPD